MITNDEVSVFEVKKSKTKNKKNVGGDDFFISAGL